MENQIILYQAEDETTSLEVLVEDESVWLTQAQMAELFQTSSQNITIHIKNVFKEKELYEIRTCKDSLHVQKEGKRKVTWSFPKKIK